MSTRSDILKSKVDLQCVVRPRLHLAELRSVMQAFLTVTSATCGLEQI